MAWQNPKTDWAVNPKNPVPEDFNRIEGNIDFLKQDIETKKGAIVNALNTVGLETQLTDTHAQIANKIVAANQGTKIYTPGTANITIPKGFHSGQGYVKGDANLKAENIAKNKSIFGVVGSYGNPIKSVQQGFFDNIGGPTDITVNISPINSNTAMFLVEAVYASNYPTTALYVKADTITDTSFGLYSSGDHGTTRAYFTWKVIEFYPELIKTLQRGTCSVAKAPDYTDVTINSVNMQKAIVIVSGTSHWSEESNCNNAGGILTSSTNLRLYAGDTMNAFWQVIEFI